MRFEEMLLLEFPSRNVFCFQKCSCYRFAKKICETSDSRGGNWGLEGLPETIPPMVGQS
jgi:hypothetical protein